MKRFTYAIHGVRFLVCAKDAAACAVLLAALGAATIGALVFGPHRLRLAAWP